MPQASQPIEVELPDGTIAEFPAGTSMEVMRSALRRRFPAGIEEVNPASSFTLDQRKAMAMASARMRVGEQQSGASQQAKSDDGPWTKYQRQPRDLLAGKPGRAPVDLLAERGARGEGPWTKFQSQPSPDEQRKFQITAPDGKTYRVSGENQEGAIGALRKHLEGGAGPRFPGVPAERSSRFPGIPIGPTHPEFDGSNIPGYNPATGMVENADPNSSNSGMVAGLTSALEGIPIAGPYLQAGSEYASAGIGSLLTGEPFGQVHGEMQNRVDSAQAANPGISTASGIGGAVLGTMPAIMAAPGAFGVGTGGFLARSAASALTGAGIGGADAAVRSGGDLESIGYGSTMGLATGLVAPGLSGLVGAGYRATADLISRRGASRIADLTPQAVNQLTKAMQADGIPAAEVQQRLAALGPDAMLADLGPNLQQNAAGLVAMPGRARGIVQDAIRGRDDSANARIISALDDSLGQAPVPSQIEARIAANQRAVGQQYEAAFQDAKAVDTKPIADMLDSAMTNLRGEAQTALQQVRGMLNVRGTDVLDPHPGALFQTRQAIDGMMDGVTDGNVRRALGAARQQVDEALTESVPGIKSVDAQYAELARQREALQRGQTVLDSGRTSPRPQELAQEVQQGALPRGESIGPSAVPVRLREGARAEIDRIVGTNANDRTALARIVKGEGDWNPQRLRTLFGEEKTARIMQVLDAERTFAETSNFVTRNSATAARQEAVRDLSGRDAGTFGIREGYMAGGALGAARSAGVTATERIISLLRGSGKEVNQAALARGLMSGETSRIAEALMQGGQTSRREAEALAKVAQALLMGPAATMISPAIQSLGASRLSAE